jgi:Peptidase inhibitor family I36
MKNRLLLTFSLAGLLLYGSAISASAVTTHQAPSIRPFDQGQYCTAQAEPVGSMATPDATCYTTFSASIRAATGGRVRLPAAAKPGSVTPDEINAAAAAVTPANVFVLSIDYKDINFGGATLTWTQSTACGSFQAASMPSGWNDVVSSVITESGCANTLYKNINFGGTTFSIGRNSSAANLGSFNDQTSSEKWCTARPCG